MKKLVLMFVAIAAISFASCGNKANQNAGADTTKMDTTVQNDSNANDSNAVANDSNAVANDSNAVK